MRAYLDALLRYFEFGGRSSRAQYWLFELFCVLLTVAAVLADLFVAGKPLDRDHPGFFLAFVMIFHLVPSVTVTVRRLHDIGKSGWWYLLCFVPFGAFVVLYWTCRRGDSGDNDFGSPDGDAPVADASYGYAPPAGRAIRIGSAAPRRAVALDQQSISTQRFI